jgi:RimJ/RimL family protein N-acetyltransferase
MTTRVLCPGDEAALERFLAPRADTSMFLRSNSRAVGLLHRQAPLHGTYLARFENEEIVGVAAHAWNGIVLLQAPPEHLAEVVRGAVAASDRVVTGFSGAWSQCVAARTALGLDDAPTLKCSREDLFALSLDALVVPDALARGEVLCRRVRDEEPARIDHLGAWRAEYSMETLGANDSPKLREDTRQDILRAVRAGALFVLEHEGRPVATSVFNASLPDSVQIGGVWTPPSLRGRGYARAAVAGSLLEARAEGVSRSILFTDVENEPARRAYRALGYRVIGDYALMLFAMPTR